MTKAKVEPIQVPWNTQTALGTNAHGLGPDTDGGLNPEFVEDELPEPIANIEAVKSAFSGEPVKQASPFAPKPKAAVAPEPETLPMGDSPGWAELVRFVQKHGDMIIQARHPQPRGDCIDTLFRGVTVFTHATCQVRHVKIGWIDWANAQYT